MDNTKKLSEDLITIIKTAVDNKIYGSVEIYFEDGKITQVTQRIIKKISHKRDQKKAVIRHTEARKTNFSSMNKAISE